MDLNEYQKGALSTAKYETQSFVGLVYTTLGLTGEAGEIANKVKKIIRGDYEIDDALREKLVYELGDVFWYVATLAHELGFTLEAVAKMNLTKLQKRNEEGTVRGSGDNR